MGDVTLQERCRCIHSLIALLLLYAHSLVYTEEQRSRGGNRGRGRKQGAGSSREGSREGINNTYVYTVQYVCCVIGWMDVEYLLYCCNKQTYSYHV